MAGYSQWIFSARPTTTGIAPIIEGHFEPDILTLKLLKASLLHGQFLGVDLVAEMEGTYASSKT